MCLLKETRRRVQHLWEARGPLNGFNTLNLTRSVSRRFLAPGTSLMFNAFWTSFRKSYSARKKRRSNKGGGVEEKLQDIQLSLSASRKRWETFASMNSRACLIHDQPLFQEVLSSVGPAWRRIWRLAFPISDVKMAAAFHQDAVMFPLRKTEELHKLGSGEVQRFPL